MLAAYGNQAIDFTDLHLPIRPYRDSARGMNYGRLPTQYAPLALGLILFLAPVLLGLGETFWATEQGAQGPLIIITGLWLISTEWEEAKLRTAPSNPLLIYAALTVLIPIYIISGWSRVYSVQGFSAALILISVLYAFVGAKVIKELWFPLIYLTFCVPPPGFLIEITTQSLKLWIARASTQFLSKAGLDVAYSGSAIFIDQYELSVADACAGLNSISTLLAIGLFYIFLFYRNHWRYALVLAMLVIPIAIFANLMRVVALVMSTHFFGNALTQGVFHNAAGLITFVITLLCLFAIDKLFWALGLAPKRMRQ